MKKLLLILFICTLINSGQQLFSAGKDIFRQLVNISALIFN
jgi:hypothetical protein